MTAPKNARQPQDRKPKAKPVEVETADDGKITVELDGMTIVADLTVVTNVRLLRKMKRNDMEALIAFYEAMFGPEQLDAIEEQFSLVDMVDYEGFTKRFMEAVPNS